MKFRKWDSIDAHNYRQTGHRLLDKDEQIELAKQVERGVAAQCRLKNGRLKCPATIRCLGRQIIAGRRARQTLITHNLRLVTKWARRFFRHEPSILLDDYVGEGRLILINFTDRIGRHPKGYDWRRGAKFSTYLNGHLRRRLEDFMLDHRRVIRVPRVVNKNSNFNPKLKAEACRRIVSVVNPDVFDQTAEHWHSGRHENDPISVLIEEEENEERRRRWQLILTTTEELLAEHDNDFDELDREIFERSFGVNGYEYESERALAKRLGMSKATVGKLKRKAFCKIKNKIFPESGNG